MKNSDFILMLLILATVITGCNKDDDDDMDQSIMLDRSIAVDIPESISKSALQKGEKGDTLQGQDIYENLRSFISVGEKSAEWIDSFLTVISTYNIYYPVSFDFPNPVDGRTKSVVVTADVSYVGNSWEYEMKIHDQDGSNAMQVLWNRDPAALEAIIQPYNMDRTSFDITYCDVMYRIQYAEDISSGYERYMIVSIAGLPLDPTNPYSLDNLKMFAGSNGDIVDLYGNSNHPDAYLIDTDNVPGLNWAFGARGNTSENIGVAQIGLPPCSHSGTTDIFDTYSIYDVLYNELIVIFPSDSVQVNAYLTNTDVPGYFDCNGFVSCGTDIPANPAYTANGFNDLTGLDPFAPNTVHDMVIDFY